MNTNSAEDGHFPFNRTWVPSDAVQLACLLEASAPKAGNVHPAASFSDMHFGHFAASAIAIAGSFRHADTKSVGELILEATVATRTAVGRNTNLGTLLLFGPLATAASRDPAISLRQRVENVLSELSPADCRLVYEAICVANPGGMGSREQNDVSGLPPEDLIQAMAQVAEYDAVARQYTTGFADLFDRLLPWLEDELRKATSVLDAVCRLQLRWLAYEPDGLIVRKLGPVIAAEVQRLASLAQADVRAHSGDLAQLDSYQQLDEFLRGDGHRRNPGTTADLIAATLLLRLL